MVKHPAVHGIQLKETSNVNRCHCKELGGLARAGLELPLWLRKTLSLSSSCLTLSSSWKMGLDDQVLFILFLNTAAALT